MTEPDHSMLGATALDRRTFLRATGGGAVAAAVAGAASQPTVAQETTDLDAWFEGVENYDGVVDARGRSEVSVAVGAEGNGGGFAFEPAAVRVDPGTTVVWEWTGDGGAHDVVDEETGYASDLRSAAGSTYALTFDGQGISRYACTPHEAMGMKGAVVVGDPAADASGLGVAEVGVWGLLFAAVLSPFALAALVGRHRISGGPGRTPRAR